MGYFDRFLSELAEPGSLKRKREENKRLLSEAIRANPEVTFSEVREALALIDRGQFPDTLSSGRNLGGMSFKPKKNVTIPFLEGGDGVFRRPKMAPGVMENLKEDFNVLPQFQSRKPPKLIQDPREKRRNSIAENTMKDFPDRSLESLTPSDFKERENAARLLKIPMKKKTIVIEKGGFFSKDKTLDVMEPYVGGIPPEEAKKYLIRAGNDKEKARQLAREDGWEF